MPEKSAPASTVTTSQVALQIRSFNAADRMQVARLLSAEAPDSMNCGQVVDVDQIEEKYFRRPQDHFWVADALSQIVGTVAICMQDGEVAHLHCLCAIGDSTDHLIGRRLVEVAAGHARRQGSLKLVIHAQANVRRAAQFLHRLGFEFSRQREIEQQSILEFYLNLYEPPELKVEP